MISRGAVWQRLSRRRVAVVATVALLAIGVSCSDETADPAASATAPTTTVSAATDALMARLASVDTADLVLGREFNAQFLSLQFQAVGLSSAEAECAVGNVVALPGTDFAARPVSALLNGTGITPDVLTSCVPTERLMALAERGGTPDLSRAPASVVRATFTELASAGYESVGLTPMEASCVATAVVGSYGDGQLAGPLSSLAVDTALTRAALPGCLSEERIVELGR